MGTTDIVALIESPGREERVFGFASSNFFPSLLAAIEVYDERRKLFPEVEVEPALRIAKLRLPGPANASSLASQLDCGIDQIKKVNYALSEPIWQGRYHIPAGYVLKIPANCTAKISEVKLPKVKEVLAPRENSAAYGGEIYKVRKGDTLTSLAQRFGISTEKLRKLNDIESDSLKAGQTLVVRLHEGAPPRQPLVDKAKVSQLRKVPGAGLRLAGENREPAAVGSSNSGNKKSQTTVASVRAYKVAPGDTLYSLARKFSTTVEALKRENKISGASLHVGTTIKIPSK